MESATVYLTPETVAELRALSKRTRVPWTVYVRDAVEEWRQRNGHLFPGGPGSAEGDTALLEALASESRQSGAAAGVQGGAED